MATGQVILNCARMAPDMASVDRIARLRLCMRRHGCDLRLANVSEELRQVIDLAGLAEMLGVEVQRQPEQRE
ncbi:MAG TPA: hypothetical protein VFR33_11305 [Candidatus Dormibacteraeota bacterium]|nr:hypothetical protein [Candidatus Dormibacteraeota bacterium]